MQLASKKIINGIPERFDDTLGNGKSADLSGHSSGIGPRLVPPNSSFFHSTIVKIQVKFIFHNKSFSLPIQIGPLVRVDSIQYRTVPCTLFYQQKGYLDRSLIRDKDVGRMDAIEDH